MWSGFAQINVDIGSLTEVSLEHCAAVLFEELTWGHTVVREANDS